MQYNHYEGKILPPQIGSLPLRLKSSLPPMLQKAAYLQKKEKEIKKMNNKKEEVSSLINMSSFTQRDQPGRSGHMHNYSIHIPGWL